MSSVSRSRSHSRSRSPNRRPRVTSKRVVVANIPYDLTWNKLKQLFRDRVGFTGFLKLMKSNGRPNGMGVMEFKTIEGAEKAIEVMHRFEIGERKIIVREETLRDKERMAQMDYDGPNDNGGMIGGSVRDNSRGGPMMQQQSQMGVGAAGNANGSLPGGAPILTPNMLERMGIRGPITDSLYISNLDYKVDWKKVKDVFKLAGRVVHVSIKQDENGRSRGIAIVRFENPYEALLALVMLNGQTINDRPIRIKIDREGTQVPSHLSVFPPTPSGGAAAASFMAHLNNAALKSSNDLQPQHQQNSIQQQQPQFIPQQGGQSDMAAAAAMAALLSGGNMPYIAAAQLRGSAGGAPPELINTLLNAQQQQGGIGSNLPPAMMAAAAAQRGFSMSQQGGGLNSLSQLMGLQGGAGMGGSGSSGFGNSGMNNQMLDNQSPIRGVGGSGQMRGDNMSVSSNAGNFSGIQQLLMAAAAGGMSQEQISSAAQTLGFTGNIGRDNDASGMSQFMGVGMNGRGVMMDGGMGTNDRRYGNDRGIGGNGDLRRRGEFDDEGNVNRSGGGRYSRGSMGGRQSGGGRHIGNSRSSDRSGNNGMYMKRPGHYAT